MSIAGRAPVVVMQPSTSVINVAAGLEGSGTSADPWRLTPEALLAAVKRLSWTCKTVFFPCGEYVCPAPIDLNFAELFPCTVGPDEPIERCPTFMMLREGVRFLGEGRGSVLSFTDSTIDKVQLHIHWSCPETKDSPRDSASDTEGVRQVPLFFWEFSGLNIKGNTPSVLVQFGGRTVEHTAWNSCVFDIAVNNGYSARPRRLTNDSLGDVVHDEIHELSGGARGLVIKRALQSRMELVAACHTGVACVLDTCEFNTINGSFSNGEVEDPEAKRGYSISNHAVALYLHNCVANGSASINIEVAFTGILLSGSTRGNTFGAIVSNNCDAEGVLFNDDAVAQGSRNVAISVVRRDVRQEEGVYQPLFTRNSPASVTIMNTLM
uniref:Uncharacterized protein n=1 Tax=Neobodo designis TaxID=312471 RepID=A0A6U4UF38_NEODS|mmetsp:Transcript_41077/g.126822  ORF Transcript_41077/g.126822 Transcript_41077/m.126822 type:complete len:380 (+) Transcript_41077:81-1220(+)